MPSKENAPVSIRIRLKFPDVETFIHKYSANISKGGMFIQSRAPQSVGTTLRFEVLLQDGITVLAGEGSVIWIKEYNAAQPSRVHGMGVRFTYLTPESEELVERVMAFKSGEGLIPLARSQTQEVRNLLHDAALPASEELEELSARPQGEVTAAEPPADAENADDAGDAQWSAGAAAQPGAPVTEAPATPAAVPHSALYADWIEEMPSFRAPQKNAAGWDSHVPAMLAPEPLYDTGIPPELDEEEPSDASFVYLPGYNGVTQLLETSERQLVGLMAESNLSEQQLLATLTKLIVAPASPEQVAQLEQLLEPLAAALISPADALAILRAGLGEDSAGQPPVRMRTIQLPGLMDAPEAPSLSPSEVTPVVGSPPLAAADTDPGEARGAAGGDAEEEVPTRFDPINPSLLHAAARSAARGLRTHSDSHFDLSDPEGELSAELSDELAPSPTPTLEQQALPAAADGPETDGWAKIQTSTEFLDHDSVALKDMAIYASTSTITAIEQFPPHAPEEHPPARAGEAQPAARAQGQEEQLPQELSATLAAAQDEDEAIPSLEDLAQLSSSDAAEETQPEAGEAFEIKPRKSGLFERIFGKKE